MPSHFPFSPFQTEQRSRDRRRRGSHSWLPPVGSEPIHTGSIRLLLLTAIALAALASAVSAQEPSGEPTADDLEVTERLEVRETGVLIEMPRLRSLAIRRLEPADLTVAAGERRLETTRIARHDVDSEPWKVLVYFDGLLADRRAVELAASALADEAGRLTELGPVTVVLSGLEDEVLVADSRDASRVENRLTELATSGVGADTLRILRRDLSERAIEDVFAEEVSFLRERTDRLLVHAAASCALPPCLLLYVSEGFEIEPSAAYRGMSLVALTRSTGGLSHGAIAEDLEKGLAAAGWTVLTLSLEPTESANKEERRRNDVGTDFDAWKSTTPGVQTGAPPSRGNRHSDLPGQALEVYTEPRLQQLRLLAAATTGAALRIAEQIDPELGRLEDRWWLFFLAEEPPDPDARGRVEPLSVGWAASSEFQSRRAWKERLGFAPDEEPLRSPRWARTPSPLLLTEARLRSLRRGRHLLGTLDVERLAPSEEDVSGTDLDDTAGVRFEPLADRTTVRVSGIGPAGSIRHEVVEVGESDGAPVTVELPAWARRMPAILEEVGTGRWAVLSRR